MEGLQRLWVRWKELSAWQDLEVLPLVGEFQMPGGPRMPLKPGDPWPDLGFPVQLFFEAALPPAWAGKPVWIRIKPGGKVCC